MGSYTKNTRSTVQQTRSKIPRSTEDKDACFDELTNATHETLNRTMAQSHPTILPYFLTMFLINFSFFNYAKKKLFQHFQHVTIIPL